MSAPLEIEVESIPGPGGFLEPCNFALAGHAVAVREILDRWVAPEHRYFKLRADDGGIYILRNDLLEGRWELTLFDQGGPGPRRLSST